MSYLKKTTSNIILPCKWAVPVIVKQSNWKYFIHSQWLGPSAQSLPPPTPSHPASGWSGTRERLPRTGPRAWATRSQSGSSHCSYNTGSTQVNHQSTALKHIHVLCNNDSSVTKTREILWEPWPLLFTEVMDDSPVRLGDSKPLTVSWPNVYVHRTKVIVFLVTYKYKQITFISYFKFYRI